MIFADIHNHSLYGCDDGAKTKEIMQSMIDASYADGVRYLCFSPHYNPGYFGANIEKINTAYKDATEYIKSKYPDMKFGLGNELRYYNTGCVTWINDGLCRRMNDTKYILVDFNDDVAVDTVCEALDSMLHSGYVPILAHVERYTHLTGKYDFYYTYKERGVLIQIDTRAIFGDFGYRAMIVAKKLLKKKIVDIVSSDGHNLEKRPVLMSPAYEYVVKKTGKEYADTLFLENAKRIIFNA